MRPRHASTLPLLLALGLALTGAARAAETRAFVITSDFSNGGLSVVHVDSHAMSADVATVYSDARERWNDGLLYVLNRFGQDNVQVIDTEHGYGTLRQFSTGNGSNPADIALIAPHKAYVTRYELASILIVDPTDGTPLGQVSLGPFADADGIPEMDHMIRIGNRVFVSLQRLDRNAGFQPSGVSLVVVVDADADTVIDADPVTPGTQAIVLTHTNPVTRFAFDTATGRLLLGCVGRFGVMDGGIEWIDPTAMRSLGDAITESALGGDLGALAWNGAAHSYAIVTDASFNAALVSWSAVTGLRTGTLFSPGGFSLADCDLDDRGQLWVCDNDLMAPGVSVYATATDLAVAGPLDAGLPPSQIAFDRENDAVLAVPAASAAIRFAGPWPNPARHEARFELRLPRTADASVEILDVAGRSIRTLACGILPAGTTTLAWRLDDASGRHVESGIYFVLVNFSADAEKSFVRRVAVLY
jgi:hypothetical protein